MLLRWENPNPEWVELAKKGRDKVIWVRVAPGEKRWDVVVRSDDAYRQGEKVVVETGRGLELATVLGADGNGVSGRNGGEGSATAADRPRRVVRRATDDDIEAARQTEARAEEAVRACRREADRLGVPLRPVAARSTLDGKRVTIYFTAEGRVDFRELVRTLAGALKARIELRQVGVRDETRLLGGIGPCGRPLCCATFLREFKPVSIRMAKEQNLALNPGKISGLCGRLMCCLRFEADGKQGAEGACKAGACEGCGRGETGS